MSIFNFFLSSVRDLRYNTGALPDTRPAEEKEKDYRFEETVASPAPVRWFDKPRESWRSFPEQNQRRAFSCVAQTTKKLLGVWYFLKTGTYVEFSASHIYQRRRNRPEPGMAAADALEIVRKTGATLEALVPSNQNNDSEIDSLKVEQYKEDVGSVFRIENYLTVPAGNIDVAASIIQTTRKAVMLFFYFTMDEWSRSEPQITDDLLTRSSPGALTHAVAAVDYTLWQGKKALIIEDSAHFGGISRRIITEDFYKRRNVFAGYIMGFRFDSQIAHIPLPEEVRPAKPAYEFTRQLSLTTVGYRDPDVEKLQNILKYEGLFPANIASTGIYGAITAKAVLAFQRKYKVAPTEEIESLAGRKVGPATIAKLNELY